MSSNPGTMSHTRYNFGAKTVRGRLRVSVPDGWTVEFPSDVEVAPGERKELKLNLTCAGIAASTDAGVRITGEFGDAGQPVLALRFTPAPGG